MIFFIADTHFNDEDIIKYDNRPFKTVTEMNQAIIDNWNDVVTENDIVYVVGDLGKISATYLVELNGTKYLIKGNHDNMPNQFYRDLGFEEVYDHPILLDTFWILSHEPMYVNENTPYANIFGHVHTNDIYKTISARGHCVCVERINYTPISFDTIKTNILNYINERNKNYE